MQLNIVVNNAVAPCTCTLLYTGLQYHATVHCCTLGCRTMQLNIVVHNAVAPCTCTLLYTGLQHHATVHCCTLGCSTMQLYIVVYKDCPGLKPAIGCWFLNKYEKGTLVRREETKNFRKMDAEVRAETQVGLHDGCESRVDLMKTEMVQWFFVNFANKFSWNSTQRFYTYICVKRNG